MEDIPIPNTSLRLGSRTVNSGKLVSIEDDEFVLLLSQMLNEVTPDVIMTKRLQIYLTHYAKLASLKKNAGK